MIFSTVLFLFYFLPFFMLAYHFTPIKHRNITALIGSLVFYIWGAPIFIFILSGSCIIDYYITYNFDKYKKPKLLLIISLILNIGMLAYFKYANFFVDNLNSFLSSAGFESLNWTAVGLPIGISFFTFQKISYSIDIYRKRNKPLDSVYDYTLYIILFPQLIAGPIVRFNEIADQIRDRKNDETYENKLIGFYRFIIGLSKKVLIANSVGAFADTIFNAPPENFEIVSSWIATLAYTIQIYFDFSGYSDMAIGVGRMMGFRFPENFNNPYTSKSITEFWRRWHITLSNWMRDYIYIPLGGNKVSPWRNYTNLWVVFVISGFWHGASWNFVIWGALHGFFLTIEKMFMKNILKRLGFISLIYTFILTILMWVIFRIETMDTAVAFYKSLFTLENANLNPEISAKAISFLIVGLFFSFFTLSNIGQKIQSFIFERDHYSNSFHITSTIICLILLFLSVGYITIQNFNPFIYFRF